MVKWLVDVKIYGNKPKKLLNKIRENIEIKIKVLPTDPLGPSRVLNSLYNVIKIKFQKILIRDGRSQKETGISIKPIKVLSQFKEKLKILVEGSKTENKFVIIFKASYYF